MNTYLIIYNIQYKEKGTPQEFITEKVQRLDEIKRIKDREILESIYEISQQQFKYIGYRGGVENLIIECDLKGEEFFNFIIKNIEKEWQCNEKQYLEIKVENIINLDQI